MNSVQRTCDTASILGTAQRKHIGIIYLYHQDSFNGQYCLKQLQTISTKIKAFSDLTRPWLWVKERSWFGLKFGYEGGFGFVTKCHNLVTDEMEAIKVNKNLPSVFHQARAEIAILKRLQCLDPDTCNIVKWNGYFFDRDHICLNFELLDQSLYSYMVGRDFRGLSMAELRPILFQLATTLSHLRSMDIVHADLKPDNVMIVDSKKQPLKVKLIDFGLARPVSAVEPGVCVQTTWYRAPEVMLHLPFDEAIDMWSLGLVAAELATGSPLYPGDTDYDVLRFILETQGQPADDVLDRGMGTEYYFREQRHGQQRWMFKSPEQFADHQTEQRLLVDLIKRMLELDPEQRIKPLEVLQHPFFAQSPPQRAHISELLHLLMTYVEK
uniref:Protein kinase domain-containing protein n=1 Tax=Dicentrarchus labrax TaxID=13489 RepID=A0A8P4KKQ1_DICLA